MKRNVLWFVLLKFLLGLLQENNPVFVPASVYRGLGQSEVIQVYLLTLYSASFD